MPGHSQWLAVFLAQQWRRCSSGESLQYCASWQDDRWRWPGQHYSRSQSHRTFGSCARHKHADTTRNPLQQLDHTVVTFIFPLHKAETWKLLAGVQLNQSTTPTYQKVYLQATAALPSAWLPAKPQPSPRAGAFKCFRMALQIKCIINVGKTHHYKQNCINFKRNPCFFIGLY